ncbi:muscle-specific protein 300 kDa isoform X9 [Malaya genurostris]|uniref:muscle-specific protein 300 kDa isoform X9 n=1 Tax=Malaya genurostris TaxID=325434 RepID=UPI0026F4053B|nr:muscle-specific protein 300 kDa isoform X9 [Malaya genurostris]
MVSYVSAKCSKQNIHNRNLPRLTASVKAKDCNELDTLNEISNHIIEQANQFDSSRIRKDNSEINRTWTDCIALLRNLQENLVQLQHQWVQLEDILQELEIKSNSLLEKDKSLDLSIQSKDDILAKKHAIKSLLEDKTTLGELNTKANSLAKTLISALKEQQISPHSLEEKLNHLNQVNTKLQDNLDVKLQKLQNILRELEHYSEEIYTLQKTIGQLFEDLKKIDPFDEKLFQTEKSLNSIKSTAEGYLNHKVQLQNQIKDKYLSSQPFIPNDLADQLNSLETLLTTISFTMEECDRDFKRAKTMRTDYFLAYDRIKTWIENAELTVSNHNIDPSDLKTKLTAFTLECSDLRLLCDQLVLNGNEIIKNCRNYNDRQAMQANMDQICLELIKTIQLIHDKNETVDHILGNWANFMHLYQSVIDWSVTIRLLLEKKLQLNSLPEAQLACQNYTSAVSTLADVSKHLSEMNLEFDKINEVCSTGFLKNKLHEADTVKVNMETTLFERNLFLQETTEEWQQYEHKIKSVNEWIKESYETLSSPEMKIKPLRDQLRILDQMLADISAQKIKVNMSLEKLQVHFHSEIICTDNPSIVYNGRSVLDSLDKLNTDVLQTTQNLNKTLVKIEECQYEMQTLRHHIVQEEQQLRNILSPLHQSSDSDKNEKEPSFIRNHISNEETQRQLSEHLVYTTQQPEVSHLVDMENSSKSIASFPSYISVNASVSDRTTKHVAPELNSNNNRPTVWNNSDLTYAEVVAGLRKQHQTQYRLSKVSTEHDTNAKCPVLFSLNQKDNNPTAPYSNNSLKLSIPDTRFETELKHPKSIPKNKPKPVNISCKSQKYIQKDITKLQKHKSESESSLKEDSTNAVQLMLNSTDQTRATETPIVDNVDASPQYVPVNNLNESYAEVLKNIKTKNTRFVPPSKIVQKSSDIDKFDLNDTTNEQSISISSSFHSKSYAPRKHKNQHVSEPIIDSKSTLVALSKGSISLDIDSGHASSVLVKTINTNSSSNEPRKSKKKKKKSKKPLDLVKVQSENDGEVDTITDTVSLLNKTVKVVNILTHKDNVLIDQSGVSCSKRNIEAESEGTQNADKTVNVTNFSHTKDCVHEDTQTNPSDVQRQKPFLSQNSVDKKINQYSLDSTESLKSSNNEIVTHDDVEPIKNANLYFIAPKENIDLSKSSVKTKKNNTEKFEKIRKSNSSKIIALLERESKQFEKELLNDQPELSTQHEKENEMMNVIYHSQHNLENQKKKVAPDDITNKDVILTELDQGFKSNLVFEEYDFMRSTQLANKQEPVTDVNTSQNSNGNNSLKPGDTSTVSNQGHRESTSKVTTNDEVQPTTSNDLDQNRSTTVTIHKKWRENTQKISMITHEEHLLKPISHMKLELPNVSFEKIISEMEQFPINPQQGEAEAHTEIVKNFETKFGEEMQMATEISVVDYLTTDPLHTKLIGVLSDEDASTSKTQIDLIDSDENNRTNTNSKLEKCETVTSTMTNSFESLTEQQSIDFLNVDSPSIQNRNSSITADEQGKISPEIHKSTIVHQAHKSVELLEPMKISTCDIAYIQQDDINCLLEFKKHPGSIEKLIESIDPSNQMGEEHKSDSTELGSQVLNRTFTVDESIAVMGRSDISIPPAQVSTDQEKRYLSCIDVIITDDTRQKLEHEDSFETTKETLNELHKVLMTIEHSSKNDLIETLPAAGSELSSINKYQPRVENNNSVLVGDNEYLNNNCYTYWKYHDAEMEYHKHFPLLHEQIDKQQITTYTTNSKSSEDIDMQQISENSSIVLITEDQEIVSRDEIVTRQSENETNNNKLAVEQILDERYIKTQEAQQLQHQISNKISDDNIALIDCQVTSFGQDVVKTTGSDQPTETLAQRADVQTDEIVLLLQTNTEELIRTERTQELKHQQICDKFDEEETSLIALRETSSEPDVIHSIKVTESERPESITLNCSRNDIQSVTNDTYLKESKPTNDDILSQVQFSSMQTPTDEQPIDKVDQMLTVKTEGSFSEIQDEASVSQDHDHYNFQDSSKQFLESQISIELEKPELDSTLCDEKTALIISKEAETVTRTSPDFKNDVSQPESNTIFLLPRINEQQLNDELEQQPVGRTDLQDISENIAETIERDTDIVSTNEKSIENREMLEHHQNFDKIDNENNVLYAHSKMSTDQEIFQSDVVIEKLSNQVDDKKVASITFEQDLIQSNTVITEDSKSSGILPEIESSSYEMPTDKQKQNDELDQKLIEETRETVSPASNMYSNVHQRQVSTKIDDEESTLISLRETSFEQDFVLSNTSAGVHNFDDASSFPQLLADEQHLKNVIIPKPLQDNCGNIIRPLEDSILQDTSEKETLEVQELNQDGINDEEITLIAFREKSFEQDLIESSMVPITKDSVDISSVTEEHALADSQQLPDEIIHKLVVQIDEAYSALQNEKENNAQNVEKELSDLQASWKSMENVESQEWELQKFDVEKIDLDALEKTSFEHDLVQTNTTTLIQNSTNVDSSRQKLSEKYQLNDPKIIPHEQDLIQSLSDDRDNITIDDVLRKTDNSSLQKLTDPVDDIDFKSKNVVQMFEKDSGSQEGKELERQVISDVTDDEEISLITLRENIKFQLFDEADQNFNDKIDEKSSDLQASDQNIMRSSGKDLLNNIEKFIENMKSHELDNRQTSDEKETSHIVNLGDTPLKEQENYDPETFIHNQKSQASEYQLAVDEGNDEQNNIDNSKATSLNPDLELSGTIIEALDPRLNDAILSQTESSFLQTLADIPQPCEAKIVPEDAQAFEKDSDIRYNDENPEEQVLEHLQSRGEIDDEELLLISLRESSFKQDSIESAIKNKTSIRRSDEILPENVSSSSQTLTDKLTDEEQKLMHKTDKTVRDLYPNYDNLELTIVRETDLSYNNEKFEKAEKSSESENQRSSDATLLKNDFLPTTRITAISDTLPETENRPLQKLTDIQQSNTDLGQIAVEKFEETSSGFLGNIENVTHGLENNPQLRGSKTENIKSQEPKLQPISDKINNENIDPVTSFEHVLDQSNTIINTQLEQRCVVQIDEKTEVLQEKAENYSQALGKDANEQNNSDGNRTQFDELQVNIEKNVQDDSDQYLQNNSEKFIESQKSQESVNQQPNDETNVASITFKELSLDVSTNEDILSANKTHFSHTMIDDNQQSIKEINRNNVELIDETVFDLLDNVKNVSECSEISLGDQKPQELEHQQVLITDEGCDDEIDVSSVRDPSFELNSMHSIIISDSQNPVKDEDVQEMAPCFFPTLQLKAEEDKKIGIFDETDLNLQYNDEKVIHGVESKEISQHLSFEHQQIINVTNDEETSLIALKETSFELDRFEIEQSTNDDTVEQEIDNCTLKNTMEHKDEDKQSGTENTSESTSANANTNVTNTNEKAADLPDHSDKFLKTLKGPSLESVDTTNANSQFANYPTDEEITLIALRETSFEQDSMKSKKATESERPKHDDTYQPINVVDQRYNVQNEGAASTPPSESCSNVTFAGTFTSDTSMDASHVSNENPNQRLGKQFNSIETNIQYMNQSTDDPSTTKLNVAIIFTEGKSISPCYWKYCDAEKLHHTNITQSDTTDQLTVCKPSTNQNELSCFNEHVECKFNHFDAKCFKRYYNYWEYHDAEKQYFHRSSVTFNKPSAQISFQDSEEFIHSDTIYTTDVGQRVTHENISDQNCSSSTVEKKCDDISKYTNEEFLSDENNELSGQGMMPSDLVREQVKTQELLDRSIGLSETNETVVDAAQNVAINMNRNEYFENLAFGGYLIEKSVYDTAENQYHVLNTREHLKTHPSLGSLSKDEDINQQNRCEKNHEYHDYSNNSQLCASTTNMLTDSSNNSTHLISSYPDCTNPLSNTEFPETPKLLGTTNNVVPSNSNDNVAGCTMSKQTLTNSVENILESLLSAELKMNNLPYDNINDLIKGLQILIEKLADYKQQNSAISMSVPQNADNRVKESIQQIDNRIDFLRQRAHEGLEKIQTSLKLREQRKAEVHSYFQLLDEIENWLCSESIQLSSIDEQWPEDNLIPVLNQNRIKLEQLREKEIQSLDMYSKTEEFIKYVDLQDKAVVLRENLNVLNRTIREKALILEHNIQHIQEMMEPSEISKVDNEVQTSLPSSLTAMEAAITTSSQQNTSSQTESDRLTDNILIIQSVADGREIVQISNVSNSSFLGSASDVIVEAKYTQHVPGESTRSSEILLKNIPSEFETTFVEPDESTTEIIVEKDGSKKIILKKMVLPVESIDSLTAVDPSYEPEMHSVKIKDKLNESHNEPFTISEGDDVHTVVGDDVHNVVEQILSDIQQKVVVLSENETNEVQDHRTEKSQVFESIAQKVDLIASVVESPTSTVFSMQNTSQSNEKLIETYCSYKPDSTDKTIIGVSEIWPPSEFITSSENTPLVKSIELPPVPVDSTDIATQKDSSEADRIWPLNLDIGSNSIKMKSIPSDIARSTVGNTEQTWLKPEIEEHSIEIAIDCASSENVALTTSDNEVLLKKNEENISEQKYNETTFDKIVCDTPTSINDETPSDEALTQLRVAEFQTMHLDEALADSVVIPGTEEVSNVPTEHVDTQDTNVMTHSGDDDKTVEENNATINKERTLEVQVSSIKKSHGALKLSMNIDSSDASKVNVSLIEIASSEASPDQPEATALSETQLCAEKIEGLSEVDFDKGYEADKTTPEGESETCDSQKKKKRRKKKHKGDKTESEVIQDEELKTTQLDVGNENKSKSLSGICYEEKDYDEIQRSVFRTEEVSTIVQEKVVVPTEIVETVYVEDVHQQTTPVHFTQSEEDVDQEIVLITSDKLMVSIDVEEKSIQTSHEPDVVKASQQTSPIEQEIPQLDSKEIQATINVLEIDTQTMHLESTSQREQDVQTEVLVEEDKRTPVTLKSDCTDSANQTENARIAEAQIQTTESFEEIVDPIITNIVNAAIREDILSKRQFTQTSPVEFEQLAITQESNNKVITHHEDIQTVDPEVIDAYTETDIEVKVGTTSPVQYTVVEAEIQTTSKPDVSQKINDGETAMKLTPEVQNVVTQILPTEISDNQSQTQPELRSDFSDTVTIGTQADNAEYRKNNDVKKNRKRKSKSDRLTPIEVDINTQVILPDTCLESIEQSTSKTIIQESNLDFNSEIDLNIQIEIQASTQDPFYCNMNEMIPEDKMWSISLSDYFSIVKSQKSCSNYNLIPWTEISKIIQQKHTIPKIWEQHTKIGGVVNFDADCEEDVLEFDNEFSNLISNSNNNELRQKYLFEILEVIATQMEEIDDNIRTHLDMGDSDRIKMRNMCKTKLHNLQKHTKRIIEYVIEKKVGESPDALNCFVNTIQNIESMQNRISQLEDTEQSNAEQKGAAFNMLYSIQVELSAAEERLNCITLSENLSIMEKMMALEEIENENNLCLTKLNNISDELGKRNSIDDALLVTLESLDQSSHRLENNIVLERNKLHQFNSLAEEYEQTLLEFEEISVAAEEFIDNEIATSSLEDLQEEMQRYRKFFVNLNHCKMVLESLESNLDPITRSKHAYLHSTLYHKTSSIIERAVDRAAKLAQAASKWTIYEKDMREEIQWLQVAQQRVPDLQNVSSNDFEQYIALYESLSHDILHHHNKMKKHCEIASKIQELVTAPILVNDSNDALMIMVRLREEVSLYLNMLIKFKSHWSQYNLCANKLADWIRLCQRTLKDIIIPSNLMDTPVEDMRKFWEIKGQYEVLNNKIYGSTCDSFDHALSTIAIGDEQLQRQLHSQLLENWMNVSHDLSNKQQQIFESMKTDATPQKGKIAFIEQELQDIAGVFNNTKGVLKCQEDLYLYIEKLQMLRTRVHLIDSELGQIALTLECSVDTISELFEMSRNLALQINEEHEAAEIFYKHLEDIEIGMKEQEKRLLQMSKTLDESSAHINENRPDVEKSLEQCKLCLSNLSYSWNEIMKLRQMLHTLPMNLKISVSPLQTERDLSVLQNIHDDLEQKCQNYIAQLRNRLALWNKFYRQIEMIQEHVQETEFMMELLKVQESADYNRLLKATERLDALLSDIESKKNAIDDLQSIAKPLIETSQANVSLEIQETVQKITVVWESTRESLRDLCQRYENAVKLWQQYHDVTETVRSWVSDKFTDFDSLKHIQDLPQLEIYETSIIDKKHDLEKLKHLINNINVHVGFNIGNSLLAEIDEFHKKLEHIAEHLISQKNIVDKKHSRMEENRLLLSDTNKLVEHLQQDIQKPKIYSNLKEQIICLRTYMINLSSTESRLKEIANNKHEKQNDFQNLHTLSQTLLQDTFQQYQDMLQQLIVQGNDEIILQFWQDYLSYVQTFLEQDIPSLRLKLQQFRDQCSLVGYLLRHLRTTFMSKLQINIRFTDALNDLSKRHIHCIDSCDEKLMEVNNRLMHWTNFKTLKSTLKETINEVEREKYTLQLEYINIKELPQLIVRVGKLLNRFPQLESLLMNLHQEMGVVMLFTKDEYSVIHLKNDHGESAEQVMKLKENVDTWYKFLTSVDELYSRFDSQCNQIQHSLDEFSECLDSFGMKRGTISQHHLNTLKNEQLRLASIKTLLVDLNVVKNELKSCISIFDAKLVHKRVWGLWQHYEKVNHSISMSLKQVQERLQNQKIFANQYSATIEWMTEFGRRINDTNKYEVCEGDAAFIKSVEEMLLQELALKECEVDWLNVIGKDLTNNAREDHELSEILSQLDHLNNVWQNLVRRCQNRTQKIIEVNSTTTSLQQRIDEIKLWMTSVEQELKKPFFFEGTDKSHLDTLLDGYDSLQRSIESNSGHVGEVLNLCEMLFADVESWNVHIDRRHIHHDINNLELRWKNICLVSSKRKQDMLSIWNMLLEIQKITNSHQKWTESNNEFLNSLEVQMKNNKGSSFYESHEKLTATITDIKTQEPILQILKRLLIALNKHECSERVNMRNITSEARQMLAVWESLLWRSKKLLNQLDDTYSKISLFNSEYENIIMALTKIDAHLTNLKHLPELTTDTPESKLKQLRDSHNELRFIINLFDKQDELGNFLLEHLPATDELSTEVQRKMQEYHQLANNIKQILDTILESTIEISDEQKCEQIQKQYVDPQEKDCSVQVNTLPTLSIQCRTITAKEAYQYQLETALNEARMNLDCLKLAITDVQENNFIASTQKVSKASAACESSIELIKHLNFMLISESQGKDHKVTSQLVQNECDRYAQYQSEWKEKQEEMEKLRSFPIAYHFICVHNDDYLTCPLCTNRNWQQIDNDLWRLEQWLLMAEATQKNQHTNPPADIDTLEDAIQDHRELLLDLDSHKSIIKSLNIVGEHLATHTLDTEKALKLRERLQKDNQRWETVCSYASHWQSQLHHSLMENREFHRTITELCNWLEQTENRIKNSEPIDLTSDTKLIERKYKMFRELRSDLIRCEPRVVSLQETTSQLSKYLEVSKSQKFEEIYAKLTDLRLRFHSIRRLVEIYTIKIGAALGYDPNTDSHSVVTTDSHQEIQGHSGSLTNLAAHESNANTQDEEDEGHINTTVLTKSYRFLGRVLRASLPIQAMLLLVLGVVTLMPHGEDYSCSLTNNFARSLEPMLRYPNGPPPI